MSTFRKWGGRAIIAVIIPAAAIATFVIVIAIDVLFGYTEGQESCATETPEIDIDHIGVMGSRTEEALRKHGYIPENTCGLATASYSNFSIMIGKCEGYYVKYRRDPEVYSIGLSNLDPAEESVFISVTDLDQLPTVADLIATDARFAHC